jgi:hypothetical protein
MRAPPVVGCITHDGRLDHSCFFAVCAHYIHAFIGRGPIFT